MRIKQYKAKKWVKKISAKNLKTTTPVPYEKYLHSEDKAALEVLKKIPFFDTLCEKFIEHVGERIWQIENMSSKIRVTEKQCPRIYFMVESICKKLGVKMPEVYVELNRNPNASTYGDKRVFISVTSGLLEILNDDELYAVLAHECGHIACHHVLYHTIATTILMGGEIGLSFLDKGLIAKLITAPLKLALYRWSRCSEFSADRAAAVCCRDSKQVVATMMRLAGGIRLIEKEINPNLFIEQAISYDGIVEQNKINKITEYLTHFKDSHPLLSVRACAIKEWVESDEYKELCK